MVVAIICVCSLVVLVFWCCCVAGARADEQSDRCYAELMAAKDCEQLTDESPPPAPRRVGLRVASH